MGGLVAVQGLPLGLRLAGMAALLAMGIAMYQWLLANRGRWINGFRAGRTRIVALAMVIAYLALMGVSAPAFHDGTPPISPWIAGGIMFVVAVLLDFAWMRALAADQRDGR